MNFEQLRAYCLSKKLAEEYLPFDEYTLAFTVGGKIFALTGLDEPEVRVNLKCDPELAVELRAKNEFVLPGYHMSKKHWNTVCAEKITRELLIELVDHSYDLVAKGLTKRVRQSLEI